MSAGERRLALVIGNNNYLYAPKLRNAVNDANDLESLLRELGFHVDKVIDGDLQTMEQAIDAFVAKLRPNDVAFFHYSGHGMGIEGENYLLPVDLVPKDEATVKYRSYPASLLHDRLAGTGARLNIVVLDACRDNGFRTSRSRGRGLASMYAARGSFIAFSTAPGSVADDNPEGRNGLFTEYLLASLRQPGLTLNEVFDLVRAGVFTASKERQLPWTSSSVIGRFYFRPPVAPAAPEVDAGPQLELAFWNSIKDSKNPAAFELYLRQYPQGQIAELAKLKLEELRAPIAPPEPETLPEADAPPALVTSHQPAEVQTNPKDGLDYVWIPPGRFQMGCVPGDDECVSWEKPRHEVTISRGFWMGQTEVTVAAYERFTRATKHKMRPAPEFNKEWRDQDHAIVNVTWEEAKAYCEWAGGRLPAEAEWEYAARGGKEGLKYPWGNELSHENANYGKDECCGGWAHGRDRWEYTSPVGSFDANGFGLYDMAGNVWEWVADWYSPQYYEEKPVVDPAGPESGKEKAVRGGSWYFFPRVLRVSYRYWLAPGFRDFSVGFRCVRESSSL